MHVFLVDDVEFVVAADEADAVRVLDEFYAESYALMTGESPSANPWPADTPLTMHDLDGDGKNQAKTGEQWAAQRGRGYLGSTEY